MKRCLHFLTDSSYSIIRSSIALLVVSLLTINCGPLPIEQSQTPETAPVNVEETTETPPKQSPTNLPESATVDLKKQGYLRFAFREPTHVQSRLTLYNFLTKTIQSGQPAATVVNGSFDVLKAFVAKGWAPIVMLRIQGRKPVILPVTHYNEQTNMVHLQNPSDQITRRLSYDNFEKSWKVDPQRRCILITKQRLTVENIRQVLGQYLQAEAFQKVGVKIH